MARTVSFDGEESLPAAVRRRQRQLPLTTAVRLGGQLPEEPGVEWLIRWNSPADTKRCPSGSQHHFTDLRERPLQRRRPRREGAAPYLQ